MDDDFSRLQLALIAGVSGTAALVLSAYIFDYPTVRRALVFGVMMTIVFYVLVVPLLVDAE